MAGLPTALGLLGFAWLGAFQVLLAAGAPLGRLAWGGQARVLPRHLRWASLGSAAIAAAGGLAVGQAGGMIAGPFPDGLLRSLLLALCGLFVLSGLLNLVGATGAERLHGVPLSLVLAGSTGTLAAAL